MAQNIQKLHSKGARKFLVWNAPDLGRTPALQRLDALAIPGIAAGATTLSGIYNGGLTGDEGLNGVLQGLAGLPGIEIVRFNAFGILGDIQGNPARFGLLDATTACIQPFVPPLFRCAQPDRHFFWDGIHPTRAGHAIIAFLVGEALVTHTLQDD